MGVVVKEGTGSYVGEEVMGEGDMISLNVWGMSHFPKPGCSTWVPGVCRLGGWNRMRGPYHPWGHVAKLVRLLLLQTAPGPRGSVWTEAGKGQAQACVMDTSRLPPRGPALPQLQVLVLEGFSEVTYWSLAGRGKSWGAYSAPLPAC